MDEAEDEAEGKSAQKLRFEENLTSARAFLEQLQPDISFTEKGRINADGESLIRYAEKLREEGFWTSTVAKLTGLKPAQQPRSDADESLVEKVTGPPGKSVGLAEPLRDMVRITIGRSTELTEVCNSVGLAALFAALAKSGLSMEDFKKIGLSKGSLREALEKGGEIIFRALECYDSNRFKELEEERDEARAYASMLSAQSKELIKQLNPKLELKSLMDSYILSGGVDDKIVTTLIDKWLSIEVGEIKWGVMR
jgi:hypothetical protein